MANRYTQWTLIVSFYLYIGQLHFPVCIEPRIRTKKNKYFVSLVVKWVYIRNAYIYIYIVWRFIFLRCLCNCNMFCDRSQKWLQFRSGGCIRYARCLPYTYLKCGQLKLQVERARPLWLAAFALITNGHTNTHICTHFESCKWREMKVTISRAHNRPNNTDTKKKPTDIVTIFSFNWIADDMRGKWCAVVFVRWT